MENQTKPNTEVATIKKKFSVAIREEAIQTLITNTLGDSKRAARFTASISSVVATNPALQKCDVNTVISSALVGEALELPPSPQLGYFYMVPFDETKYDKDAKEWKVVRSVATFILGWKGYVQLAIRSGQYRSINVIEIKAGELGKWNPWTEELEITFIEDEIERAKAETIGYVAGFELINGYRKVIYWSKKKMLTHADKYSKAFKMSNYELLMAGKANAKDREFSSFWYKDFDGMALKTVVRQLLGKWGIMSVEMQTAFEKDTTYTDEMGNTHYFDGEKEAANVVGIVGQEAVDKTGANQPPKPENVAKPSQDAPSDELPAIED